MEILNANTWRPLQIAKDFHALTNALEGHPYWEPLNINQFCPNQRM
jgi:hypothetical protein